MTTEQHSLFDLPSQSYTEHGTYLPAKPRFDGADYQRARDDGRLTGQLLRIWNVVKDEGWHTLPELASRTGDPEASISAQLRHLRKARFGRHTVERQHVGNGLYEYRLLMNRVKEAARVG